MAVCQGEQKGDRMKQSRWITHTVYLLVISTLLAGVWGLNHARLNAKAQLRSVENAKQDDLKMAFGRLCTELSGDLFSAVEADNLKLYLTKMTQVQTASGQALLLLSEDGRKLRGSHFGNRWADLQKGRWIRYWRKALCLPIVRI